MSTAGAVRIAAVGEERSSLCRTILEDLPEWFGIVAATDAYVRGVAALPTFGAFDGSKPVGLAAVKVHTAHAAEIYVLGVLRSHHGRGIGRALVEAVLAFAAREGLRFLTVKTLAPSRPDPNYAATRLFYEGLGFVPVEVFPTLWDPANPCLLMIRTVGEVIPRGC